VREGSLGQGLISALAAQVGGSLERVPVENGTKFQLSLSRHRT
jgi:two-component sensor histidine kinase